MCYFAYKFELRSIYQSISTVKIPIDYINSRENRIQKYKENLHFDNLERIFVEKIMNSFYKM